MQGKLKKEDYIFAYIVSFPIAVTLLFAWMVLKSDGIFTVNMTFYNEFYLEAFLFMLWIVLFLSKLPKLNQTLKLYITSGY